MLPRVEKQPSERLTITTGICGFYEPTERITTNQKTSIQNLYLPCKSILYNTIKNEGQKTIRLHKLCHEPDGKISTIERKQVRISSDEDLRRVDELRAESDAILVGMNTIVIDDPKLTIKSERLRRERLKRGLPENPIKIGIGNVNGMKLNSDFLNYGKIIVFTTENSDPEKIERLRKKADVHVLGKDRVTLNKMLRPLAGMGVKKLMIEGGGTVNFELLKESLVDEIYVTIAPRIFGGINAPTLVDGEGFKLNEAIDLKLLGTENLHDLLVLRYEIKDSKKYI
ncbi:MAG: 2,5-diamino-6-(ribosylamino)-4(3H)-pyrimidinone 5'-phosphate reductase [Chloroflexota bacterium]|nr:MAG: 2,5-diamino-6-(ribosylamino)-4(3H)-pyrimidinone 5'-phosphate reductase [Chloroflexota bacterium]